MMFMNAKNRLRGAQNKKQGELFERLIEQACIHYRVKGIADIKKTPEPLRPIGVISRQQRQFRAVYDKKAQPDFTGTLKGGRSVMFEAKVVSSTSIRFDRLNKEQERDLAMHHHLGACCFVLIHFKNTKRYYNVPFNEWMNMKENIGKKSMNEQDLHEYLIRFKHGWLEFLDEELIANLYR